MIHTQEIAGKACRRETLSELHHLERVILLALKTCGRVSFGDLAAASALPEASVSRATLWLSSKAYVRIEGKKETRLELGSEGLGFAKKGFPERILVETIVANGGKLALDEASIRTGLSKKELTIALGWAKEKGWLQIVREMDAVTLLAEANPEDGSDEKLVAALSKGKLVVEVLAPNLAEGFQMIHRRPNVIETEERIERFVSLTPIGLEVVQRIDAGAPSEVSQLTPDLIKSGEWRSRKLRRYDIQAAVGEIWPGKKQPFLRFLDELRWKLLALGFKEMKGPLIELMFFNCDALYMPQDHPAREIHDIYYIRHPSEGDLSPYALQLERVKRAHENGGETNSKGWRYQFSTREAQRLILRSQGTAVSVRMLLDERLEIPGKYFSISRCYRPDVVDRTHLTEFNQIEGIVIGEKLTFRDLLGVLERFALDVAGAEKVRFRPDYFPFTEPSVELAAYKEGFGWIELGGAGIFRPEVTLPLGIKVPVIAWGLGINRIFMMMQGINDIREIFTQNLEWLRMQKVV